MDAVDERLTEAQAAHRRHDWRTAYALFSEVRSTTRLATDDLRALGEAAWWLGLIRETLEICEEAHQRYLEENRFEQAAMVAIDTGFHWFLRGQPDIGSGWINRARRLLEDLPPCVGHGFLVWVEANERAATGDAEGAVAQVPRLVRMANDLGAPVLASLGLALEGELLVRQGDTERGFGLLDEAMLPVLAGRVPPDMAGNLYCQMMSLCHHLADVPRARRWTETTESWAESFASAVMFMGICRIHRSQLLRLAGAWDEAARASALAAAELADLNAEAVAEAQFELGEIHRLRGDHPTARRCYAAATALGRDPEPGASLLLLAEGRSEDALAALRQRLAEVDDPFARARLLRAQVDAAFVHGDAACVATAADELSAIADTFRTPGFKAWADTARGTSLILGGDPRAALVALRTALACSLSMGATYDVAVCRLLVARALEASGDPAAHAERATALTALGALGAVVPPGWEASAAPALPPGGLTPREAEILLAVADGLSNREVAAHLVISEKTVARHLANVYLKIGVGSRTAAAAWARRNGLMPTA